MIKHIKKKDGSDGSVMAKKYVELKLQNANRKKPLTKQELAKRAGYKPGRLKDGTTKYPTAIIESTQTYRDLMEQAIPGKLLAKKHKALLNKTIDAKVWNNKTKKFEIKKVIDANAVRAALDMAYKLRGDYAPVKSEVKTFNMNSLLDEINDNNEGETTIEGEIVEDK